MREAAKLGGRWKKVRKGKGRRGDWKEWTRKMEKEEERVTK